MKFTAEIKGLKELEKTLSNLPRASARRAYMKALRAGAVPVRDAARENIKIVSKPYSGMAQRAATIKIYSFRKFKGSYRVGVQVRRGLRNPVKLDKDKQPVRVAMYLAVMEYGSTKLKRRPRPWIRKAVKERAAEAIADTRSEFFKLLPQVIEDAKR